MIITKEFTFDSAHQLVGHNGKCANVHGHTYKLQVSMKGELEHRGSSSGMVMDFTDVKEKIKPLLDHLDHAFLAQGNEPIMKSIDTKFVRFGFRTTAENMVLFVMWWCHKHDLPVWRVALWETPTGSAMIHRDDYRNYMFKSILSISENMFENVVFFDGKNFMDTDFNLTTNGEQK